MAMFLSSTTLHKCSIAVHFKVYTELTYPLQQRHGLTKKSLILKLLFLIKSAQSGYKSQPTYFLYFCLHFYEWI